MPLPNTNLTYELPEVVPMDRSGKTHEGFVTLKGRSYAVAATEEGVWCDPENVGALHKLLPPSAHISSKQHRSAGVFLEQLAQLRASQAPKDRTVEQHEEEVTAASVTALREALDEVADLGWDRLAGVSADLSALELRCEDAGGRQHRLEAERRGGRRRLRADLPGQATNGWEERQLSLSALFALFEAAVSSLQPFFQEMDALDAAVWVLEPERPGRADCYRRIALGEGASVRVDLDPSAPRGPPQLQFLGPEPAVGPLRRSLDANFPSWNPELALLENLQKVLQVTFPRRAESAREDMASLCGVCYSFSLQGELPEVSCRSERCRQVFHASCLTEWLRMLPSSRRVFSALHGECPYCSQIIVVTVRLEK